MSSILELLNIGTSKWRSGVIRYLAEDKDLKVSLSCIPKFTKISLFRLMALIKCPKMAMCNARCYWILLRGHNFIEKIRHILLLPQWFSWEVPKEFEGRERLMLAELSEKTLWEPGIWSWALNVDRIVKSGPRGQNVLARGFSCVQGRLMGSQMCTKVLGCLLSSLDCHGRQWGPDKSWTATRSKWYFENTEMAVSKREDWDGGW